MSRRFVVPGKPIMADEKAGYIGEELQCIQGLQIVAAMDEIWRLREFVKPGDNWYFFPLNLAGQLAKAWRIH